MRTHTQFQPRVAERRVPSFLFGVVGALCMILVRVGFGTLIHELLPNDSPDVTILPPISPTVGAHPRSFSWLSLAHSNAT